MPSTMSRRALFTAGLGSMTGGAMVASPALTRRAAAAAPASTYGPLVVLRTPLRVFDSRTEPVAIGGGRLVSGQSVAVTVSAAFADIPSGFAHSVFVNCTITQTLGSGYLVIRGSDLTGELPLPSTSNINWTGPGQTLANLVLSEVGGESALEVHCAGGGSTQFIVDVQGYVPYLL